MKNLILKKEFFGGILYNKKLKENLYLDDETYEILDVLDSNNIYYEKDREFKIKS